MTSKASSNDILVDTLVEAGISRTIARKAKIIAWSSDDVRKNELVHAQTNTLLINLLERDELGTCIHVTGGARALTDPFHRRVCEAMLREEKTLFQVLYHVPKSVIKDDWDLISWNLKKWNRKGFSDWREKLRTLNLIGEGAVDLKAYSVGSDLQYSVFGHRYTQVQGKHKENDAAKYVWLIESEAITERLSEVAERHAKQATSINEEIFSRAVSASLSNSARAMLNKIYECPNVLSEEVMANPTVELIDPEPSSTFQALKVISFLDEDETGKLTLTDDGHALLGTA